MSALPPSPGPDEPLRIAYIAAGAAGMYCGSCIHDNTAAAALQRLGHEVALLPTYTPLRTDEEDVSSSRVFYGAINVYLEQKVPLFRKAPRPLRWLLDRPALLDWVSRFSSSTDARDLGDLTLGVLQGEEGPERRELDALVTWLAETYRPHLVHITNSLFLGLVRRIRRETGAPVVVGLQGEDLFFDQLREPWRGRVLAEMRRRAQDADGFLAPSRWYAGHMAEILEVPRERIHVVPLGIRTDGHGPPSPDPAGHGSGGSGGSGAGHDPGDRPRSLGYFARICPEKGFHLAVDTFRRLAKADPTLRLKAGGWLGDKDRPYFEEAVERLRTDGLEERFDFVGEVDRQGKIDLLRSVDLFLYPTTYPEPKGLPLLEAMANGVPVLVPDHGSLPEIVEATGGGLRVPPNDPDALAATARELLTAPERRADLGRRGREAVLERFDDRTMAEGTLAVYRRLLAAEG